MRGLFCARELATALLVVALAARRAAGAFSRSPAAAVQAADPRGSAAPVLSVTALSGDVAAHWTLNLDEKRMYVAVEAKTTGWVGLGFGEAAAMRGADIAVARVAGGNPHVVDYHAIGNQAPIQDGRSSL